MHIPHSLLGRALGGFLLLAAIAGCNGKSKLAATIGAFNLGDAKFAFFGRAEGSGVDLDGNDINDSTASVVVVITDHRSLCRDLGNLSIADDLSALGDAQLLIFNADLSAADTDDSPLTNGVVMVAGPTIGVDLRFVAFTAAAQAAAANDDTAADTSLTVKGLNPLWLRGSLTSTLNDGTVDIPISGDFRAHHCPALDDIALTGGL